MQPIAMKEITVAMQNKTKVDIRMSSNPLLEVLRTQFLLNCNTFIFRTTSLYHSSLAATVVPKIGPRHLLLNYRAVLKKSHQTKNVFFLALSLKRLLSPLEFLNLN